MLPGVVIASDQPVLRTINYLLKETYRIMSFYSAVGSWNH